jgi:hypothetical protein
VKIIGPLLSAIMAGISLHIITYKYFLAPHELEIVFDDGLLVKCGCNEESDLNFFANLC